MKKCPNCGAPLPSVAPGQVEVCPYCHVETRDAPRPPPPPPPTPERWRRFESDDDDVPSRIPGDPLGGQKGFLIGVGVLVAAIFAMTAYFLWSKAAKKSTSPPSAATISLPASALPAAPLPSVLTLANLRTAHFSDGNEWRAIVAPGMVGSYEAFDVASNCDWASRIATSWNAGAVLTRVLVSRIARDGTVNVSQPFQGGKTQSEVDYMFTAAGAGDIMVGVNDSSTHVPTTSGATPHVAILVRPSTTARLDPTQPPFAKPACSLAQAFTAAAKPIARAAANPAGLDPGFGATLLNNGIATHWVLSYATVAPGSTSLQGHEAVVNAMTCVLEKSM